MPDELTKLRPDRDLQCYFQEPTAVAALSGTSAAGFTVSGSWRQQFDWAVVEWNRDNVFEHPALRNLPDGDFSQIKLSYQETRTNCVPIDSTSYDPVGWSYLRIWEESGGSENLHCVPLLPFATAVSGGYAQATAQFSLQGSPTAGDYVELAWLDQHSNYLVSATDTLDTIVAGLAGFINGLANGGVTAEADGSIITLTYTGEAGANGNRVGIYGGVRGAGTESWSPAWQMFSGGASPSTWQVNLDFGTLTDSTGAKVTTTNVRKMRWTWSADWQFQNFARSEFSVSISNWEVSGSNITYSVAGPGSWRMEDSAGSGATYLGSWTQEPGNYSGGTIHHTTTPGSAATIAYSAPGQHVLYLGTRYTNNGGQITVSVDDGATVPVTLARALEDVLVRVPLGQFSGGAHAVSVTHTGAAGTDVYLDFLEIAYPTVNLPSFPPLATTTLATDWDTDAVEFGLAPERTAWLIDALGFRGRANHYAGALWFYELTNPGMTYASATVTFAGTPEFGKTTTVTLGGAPISHVNLISDTAASMAQCFALLIAAGSSAVWARADGATLTIIARAPGTSGNGLALTADTGSSTQFTAMASGNLAGGVDGAWLTDLTAAPRINRACRDWTASFLGALNGYGIVPTVSFSMELGNGDDSAAVGIAQRYPDGTACRVSTPALQTNFSTASSAFWQEVYADMAAVMSSAGVTPYLQFGEVQWWYFPGGQGSGAGNQGMPFYDAYTTTAFQTQFGRVMQTIPGPNSDPSQYPQECTFLPGLIGQFCATVIAFVRQSQPAARFEVLYPVDTNDTTLMEMVNFPAAEWTAANLACLKTENFGFTAARNLDEAAAAIGLPVAKGFPATQSSHLVGISDYTTPWAKEWALAVGAGMESAVLFALDQFCLIGYALPLESGTSRALFMGTAR